MAGLQRTKVGKRACGLEFPWRMNPLIQHHRRAGGWHLGMFVKNYAMKSRALWRETSGKIFGETGGGEGCSITPRGKTSTLASG